MAGVCNEVSKRSRSARDLTMVASPSAGLAFVARRAAHPAAIVRAAVNATARAATRLWLMARVLLDITQICEFALEPADLICFLGLFQSVLVFLAGIPIFSDFAVGVT